MQLDQLIEGQIVKSLFWASVMPKMPSTLEYVSFDKLAESQMKSQSPPIGEPSRRSIEAI